MAAVTKGSGKYFHDFDRVWNETLEAGVAPFWVGKLPEHLKLAAHPDRGTIKSLAEGTAFLNHVQGNRVGCFDVTVSMSKSVSLLAYGLTPPDQWKGWTETFARIATPEVEKLVNNQRINSGAQGKNKQPSEGVAAAFWHRESYLGQPHAHGHYAVFNVSVGQDGKVGSVANAREMFEQQGVLRARVQKGLDDELQSRGIETVRIGKKVELAGVPKELREEISPAKQAMKVAQEEKGFSGAKAQDFYARQARQDAGPRVHKTPEEAHRDCKEVAAKYGVTLDSLTKKSGPPTPPRDPATEMATAFHVAKDAVKSCAKVHGTFTAEQFQEKLFTLGIGKPTTVAALDAMGKATLQDRSIADVQQKKMSDGSIRYIAPASARAQQAAQQPYRPDTKEAWNALKDATKGLGEAVFIATAKKATEVVDRIKEMVKPEPKVFRVDVAKVPALIDSLRPTPYVEAHAKAILAGLFKASGNPHERAGYAEKVYANLRSHEHLPKNAVIIVERGELLSNRELSRLSKLAQRDGASVVVSERDTGQQQHRQQSHQQGHTRTP